MPSGMRRASARWKADRRRRRLRLFAGELRAHGLEFGIGPERIEAHALGRNDAETAPEQAAQLDQRRVALAREACVIAW